MEYSKKYQVATPNPEFLIKSISEQGYSLETAIADLIDNSISANALNIEILTIVEDNKIKLFLADDGDGMDEESLSKNMLFPSGNLENARDKNDLGRFGLGMKTASFSQTRHFTVISKLINTNNYSGRTWDVDYLKECGEWRIIKNDDGEIFDIIDKYVNISSNDYLNQIIEETPNTLIVWEGLYKFENFVDKDRQYEYLKKQLVEETKDYIGTVFHKFIESEHNPIKIRINNILVEPFNPFKSKTGEYPRSLGKREMKFGDDVFGMEGFILPVAASDEENNWTNSNNNLMDLEGLYIYRGDRIIYYGGWNKIIRKEPKLKLARLRINVSNINDIALQLNVSKSKISIPYDLKNGVLRYVIELRDEAKKEYGNRGLRSPKSNKASNKNHNVLKVTNTTKGALYSIDEDFSLLKLLREGLSEEKLTYLKLFIRAVNLKINKQRHTDKEYIEFIEKDKSSDFEKIIRVINTFKETGSDVDDIYDTLLKDLGYNKSNIPAELKKHLQ